MDVVFLKRRFGNITISVDRPQKVNDHCVDGLRYGLMKLQAKNKIEGATRKVGW